MDNSSLVQEPVGCQGVETNRTHHGMVQDACPHPCPGRLIPPPPVYTSVDGNHTGRAVWAPCTLHGERPVHEQRSCFFGSDMSTSFGWGAPRGPGDIWCRCWVVAFSDFMWANSGTSLWALRLRPHLSSIRNGATLQPQEVWQALEAEQLQLMWVGERQAENSWHPTTLGAGDPQDRVLSGWSHWTEQKLLPLNLVINPQPLYLLFSSLVAQSCPTLWDPMDCSPPGSSVCG